MPLHDKIAQKLVIEGNYFNIIKAINDKIADIILSREKLKVFSKIRKKTRMPTHATFI